MRGWMIFLTLICAGLSAACGATGVAGDGVGYARLTPAAATRTFIIANDRAFAKQVAAHNAQCAKDEGCRK